MTNQYIILIYFFFFFKLVFERFLSPQQCLLALIELWKANLDNKNAIGALLTDLSKAFDSVNHKLLTPKLHVYSLDFTSLKLIHSYLNKQKQVKISNYLSTALELKHCIPKELIVGTLFSVYIFVFSSTSLMHC